MSAEHVKGTSEAAQHDVFAQLRGLRGELGGAGVDVRQLLATRDLHRAGRGQVSRFVVHELLGQGGCGSVFRAFDPQLGRWVALKVPLPHLAAKRDFRRRFLFEAQAMARLAHPNIAPVYEVGGASDEVPCFLAAELCPGPSLAQWLAEHRDDGVRRTALDALASLADALDYVHQSGIVHRDIKPSNVLLYPRGDDPATEAFPYVAKLTDFGLAKNTLETAAHSTTAGIAGTLKYMAPEQVLGRREQIGAATDVYALGTVLYEVVAGRAPFESENSFDLCQQIVGDAPPPLPDGTPEALVAMCRKALAKDPGDRYGSAQELAVDLHRHVNQQPPEFANRRTRRRASRRRLAAAVLCVGLVAAAGIWWGMSWSSSLAEHAANTGSGERLTKVARQRARAAPFDSTFDQAINDFLATGDEASKARVRVLGADFPIAYWKHPETGLLHGYQLVKYDDPISWQEASALAEQMSGDGRKGRLATITHPAEHEAVLDKFFRDKATQRLHAVWIGLARADQASPWQWVTGEPFAYSDWHPWAPGAENLGVYEAAVDEFGKFQWRWGARRPDDPAATAFLVEYPPTPQ